MRPIALTEQVNGACRPLVGIWLCAFILRAACVLWLSATPRWDGVIYERAAEQLARGEGYTQRILGENAPATATAFFPPGFPALLSVLHRYAGGPDLDPWLQALASSSLVPGAWFLGRRLGGARAGRYAAWLVAVWPGGVLLSASWFTEPAFGALLCVAWVPVLYARARARLHALAWAAALLGLSAYLRPTGLAVALAAGAAVGFARHARPPRRRLYNAGIGAAMAFVIACLPLAPWILRNQAALGSPVLVSSNGGFNLLIGTLGEGTYQDLAAEDDCPRGMREVDVDRCRRTRALERIARDPLAWAARGVLKLVHTVGHDSAPAQSLFGSDTNGGPQERTGLLALALCRAFWLPFLGLAWSGGLHVLRDRGMRARGLLLLAPALGMLTLHFVYIGGDRYHAPLVPFFAALAGLALVRIFPARGPVPANRRAKSPATRDTALRT